MEPSLDQLLRLQKELREMGRLTTDSLFDLRHRRKDTRQYPLLLEQGRVLYRALAEVFGKPDARNVVR